MAQQIIYILNAVSGANQTLTYTNDPPVWLTIPNQEFDENVLENISMNVYAQEPENESMVITLDSGTALPNGFSFDEVTQQLKYTGAPVTPDTYGPYTLTASDPVNPPVQSGEWYITIHPAPSVPGGGSGGAEVPLDWVGLHSQWGPWDSPTIDYPIVKGLFATAGVTNVIPNGNWDQPQNFNYFNIERNWTTGHLPSDKYWNLNIFGKKNADWKKWWWTATNAQALGAERSEDPPPPNDWIGAYWSDDGVDVMEGIANAVFACFDAQDQDIQDRCLGVRINVNSLAGEGTDPGSTLANINHSAWVRGSLAGPRPNSWTGTVGDTYISQFWERVMDTVFPSGDSNPGVYRIFLRARTAEEHTLGSTSTRIDNLFKNNKIYPCITSGDHEPRNNFAHLTNFEKMYEYCVDFNNTGGYVEMFGNSPDHSNIQGNFSQLQYQYWASLAALHMGASFVTWRTVFLDNYDLAAGSLRDEWRAAMTFTNKYAGYKQFPSTSPGAWVAFREGNRWPGNYEMLASQVTTGTGDRGTELWAGSNGTSFPFPSTDDVGPGSGSNPNTTNAGSGQRQSMWAFRFTTGQEVKIALDPEFAASLASEANFNVNIHYYDNNGSAEFETEVFGVDTANTTSYTNSGNWIIKTINISGHSINTDADGAHIVLDITTGPVTLHMIEVSKD